MPFVQLCGEFCQFRCVIVIDRIDLNRSTHVIAKADVITTTQLVTYMMKDDGGLSTLVRQAVLYFAAAGALRYAVTLS